MNDNNVQLTFDLGDEVSLNRDDFIVSTSNKDAIAWIDSWPNWPVNVPGLNIFGAPSNYCMSKSLQNLTFRAPF